MDGIKKFGHKTFSSLKIRNYRLYFIGQSISMSGTWMQTVAQGWLVLQLTHSGAQLGSVVALQFLPMLIAGPWGGLIADRFNKRGILYYTQSASGLLALGISILVFSGTIQIWMVYIFAMCLGIVRIFDDPARQAFVSELVGSTHVKNAVSLNATANNLARVVGPSIGGILIAGVGIAFCFLLNALSYIATIVMLFRMNGKELRSAAPRRKKSGELKEGFRYVMSSPIIRNTLSMMAFIGTFAYEFQISLPILAKQTFNGDAASYAALMSAFGAGSVVGGLFSAGRHKVAPRHLIIFAMLFGASLIAVSLMPTLILATMGMAMVGFFSINVLSLGNTMLQLESVPEMRGRVMALWGMAMIGSTPIGGPIIGLIGEYMGGRWGVGVGGIAAVATAAVAALTLLKNDKVETIPESVQIRHDEAAVENVKIT